MNRIFAALAVLAMGLLGSNLLLGLHGGDYNRVSSEYRKIQHNLTVLKSSATVDQARVDEQNAAVEQVISRLKEHQQRASRHMLLGLFATLVTVLVNSLCVTYFIGTGRWCKEVSDTYLLDTTYDDRSRRLKRTTFPWSLLGIVSVLAIAALGAAADPGTLRSSTADWVAPHFLVAMGGIAVIGLALWQQYHGIQLNFEIIKDVMRDVRQAREAKGLSVEPPPIEVAR